MTCVYIRVQEVASAQFRSISRRMCLDDSTREPIYVSLPLLTSIFH
jgi:hypothetical protein